MTVLDNPLNEISRRERKYLLMTSAIGIFVAFTGVIPTKISALGIELNASEQKAFLLMLALIIGYFLLAFLIYGFKDFLNWRIEYQSQIEESLREALNQTYEDHIAEQHDEVRDYIKRLHWPYKLKKPTVWIHIIFEFVFPIFVALFAISRLVFYG